MIRYVLKRQDGFYVVSVYVTGSIATTEHTKDISQALILVDLTSAMRLKGYIEKDKEKYSIER